jgi:CheY-like chemotaxis protein
MNAEATIHSPHSITGGSLLVVDDHSMNRIMLSRYITKLGYQATLVANRRQALAHLQSEPCDLVLLDVEMPEMDGYQVLEHLKADPRLRDIPVIMISAVEELESVARCIELGAQNYLPKPFNPVLLRARLTACLERKRLRDQEVDVLVLRPDQQDFQGTAVTVEVARKLKVKRLLLVVNKVLPRLDVASLRQQVETAYDAPVAGLLPVWEEMIAFGSAGIFSLAYPDHPYSQGVREIATQVMK